MASVLQLLFDALSRASLYALLAMGVTLIFGLTGIVNFAQGQLLMLGGYVTWEVDHHGVNFYLSIVAGIAAMGAFGAALHLGLFRHTLRRPITGFIVSLGLISALDATGVALWGTDPKSVFPPLINSWTVGGAVFPSQRVFVIGVTVVVVVSLFAVLRFTHWGRGLRAAAESREMASVFGVPVRRVVLGTFVLGSALAGLAGAMVVSLVPITPYVGEDYIFFGFAIALLGGLGNVFGAVLAALLVALAQATVERYLSATWVDGYVLTLMIVILLVAPRGLTRGTGGSSVV
jgi:branched-chain amino acid transport system permease protein